MKMKFIILFLLIVGLVVNTSFAEEASKEYKEYVIKVTGSGRTFAKPDSFTLIFSVESESGNLQKATKDNAEKMSIIMEEIKKLNIPNLEFSTSIFEFAGDKDYTFILPGNKYKIKNVVNVKAEKLEYDNLSDYVSGIIDTAINKGASEAGRLWFYLENDKSAEETALRDALNDAKNKALVITKELGVRLKEPYNILGTWTYSPMAPIRERGALQYGVFAEKAMGAEIKPQVSPGKQEFAAYVELEFKFEGVQ